MMTVPSLHQDFIDRALVVLGGDERILGVALAGSYASGRMDEHSDLDFVLVVRESELTLSPDRFLVAESLGGLLQAFTGEHVGEPRLIIALYGPPLLHVDMKFISLDQLAHRVDDPIVLLDRTGQMAEIIAANPGRYPRPDAQWMEDRFWVWIHYCAAKLRRGEAMEAYTAIGFLLERVIVPLAMDRHGHAASGVRRVELANPPQLAQIRAACIGFDPAAIRGALQRLVNIYLEVRPDSVRVSPAQSSAIDYLAAS